MGEVEGILLGDISLCRPRVSELIQNEGKGPEQRSLEILSYDPIKRTHASSGFQSDGATRVAPAISSDGTAVETGTTTTADGKIIKWRGTWVFGADQIAVSATQESNQEGVLWTSFTVKGTKAKTPPTTKKNPRMEPPATLLGGNGKRIGVPL